jgi:hypothetical protein
LIWSDRGCACMHTDFDQTPTSQTDHTQVLIDPFVCCVAGWHCTAQAGLGGGGRRRRLCCCCARARARARSVVRTSTTRTTVHGGAQRRVMRCDAAKEIMAGRVRVRAAWDRWRGEDAWGSASAWTMGGGCFWGPGRWHGRPCPCLSPLPRACSRPACPRLRAGDPAARPRQWTLPALDRASLAGLTAGRVVTQSSR